MSFPLEPGVILHHNPTGVKHVVLEAPPEALSFLDGSPALLVFSEHGKTVVLTQAQAESAEFSILPADPVAEHTAIEQDIMAELEAIAQRKGAIEATLQRNSGITLTDEGRATAAQRLASLGVSEAAFRKALMIVRQKRAAR